MSAREGFARRETLETSVEVRWRLDGQGRFQGGTGIGMLDHLLAQVARHGAFDLEVRVAGEPWGAHHRTEDTALVMGRALRDALGDGSGITRMGHALVPMDEALAVVAVDLGGRGYAVVETGLEGQDLEGLPGDLVGHFLESMALSAGLTLHAQVLRGKSPHHRAEALFKALARALRDAVRPDPALGGTPPSTKGTTAPF